MDKKEEEEVLPVKGTEDEIEVLVAGPEHEVYVDTILNTIALLNGADILRVHNVKNAVELKKTFIFAER